MPGSVAEISPVEDLYGACLQSLLERGFCLIRVLRKSEHCAPVGIKRAATRDRFDGEKFVESWGRDRDNKTHCALGLNQQDCFSMGDEVRRDFFLSPCSSAVVCQVFREDKNARDRPCTSSTFCGPVRRERSHPELQLAQPVVPS